MGGLKGGKGGKGGVGRRVRGRGKGRGNGRGDRYHGDGHDAWVRDGDGAEEIRAVGFGREFDGHVRDGQAAEPVQAWARGLVLSERAHICFGRRRRIVLLTLHGCRFAIVHRRGRKAHLVESGLATDVDVDLLVIQHGHGVSGEGVHVGDPDLLVHDRGGVSGGVERRDLDVGVGIASAEGEGDVERVQLRVGRALVAYDGGLVEVERGRGWV